jgi:SAM-dependent methyltransferase
MGITPDGGGAASQYVMGEVDMTTEDGRLEMLEQWHDPGTMRRLGQLGIESGWDCLEVGAGRGSITRWLADEVGPTGSVVAADINPRFLAEVPENVEVRQLDICQADIETERYDLIHCRALLMHLPDPGAVLTKMVGALRPGGLLLAEEGDFGLSHTAGHPDAPAVNGIRERTIDIGRKAGLGDAYLGRKLPGMLVASGLEFQGGEVDTRVAQPGELEYEWTRISVLEVAKKMLAAGMIDDADQALLENFYSNPGTVVTTTLSMVAAVGRKPSQRDTVVEAAVS